MMKTISKKNVIKSIPKYKNKYLEKSMQAVPIKGKSSSSFIKLSGL